MRSGIYIVPTNHWYVERAVWLIAGIVLLTSTALALLVQPLFILGVTATGLVSISVAFTGFCPVANALHRLGLAGKLGDPKAEPWYRMKTDAWYLERRIYPMVGFNITLASILTLTWTKWAMAFTGFVGVAMVWFAATGFCIMANGLYWLGAEPRLQPLSKPETAPAGHELSPTPIATR